MIIRQGGGNPRDFSANQPAVPSGTPLITVPADPGRASIEVQNQSAAQISIVRDDGTGNVPSISTLYLAGSGAGQTGDSWSSQTFKGRLRIYAPSDAQIAVTQE